MMFQLSYLARAHLCLLFILQALKSCFALIIPTKNLSMPNPVSMAQSSFSLISPLMLITMTYLNFLFSLLPVIPPLESRGAPSSPHLTPSSPHSFLTSFLGFPGISIVYVRGIGGFCICSTPPSIAKRGSIFLRGTIFPPTLVQMTPTSFPTQEYT